MGAVHLAILLATSWLGQYTIDALHEELMSKRLYTKPDKFSKSNRQHTLTNLIAWSYHLLNSNAQILFRRLAIVKGRCSFKGVIRISDLGDLPNESAVHTALLTLSTHHLITFTNDTVTLAHETIRTYAKSMLSKEEEKVVTKRYTAYMNEISRRVKDDVRKAQAFGNAAVQAQERGTPFPVYPGIPDEPPVEWRDYTSATLKENFEKKFNGKRINLNTLTPFEHDSPLPIIPLHQDQQEESNGNTPPNR